LRSILFVFFSRFDVRLFVLRFLVDPFPCRFLTFQAAIVFSGNPEDHKALVSMHLFVRDRPLWTLILLVFNSSPAFRRTLAVRTDSLTVPRFRPPYLSFGRSRPSYINSRSRSFFWSPFLTPHWPFPLLTPSYLSFYPFAKFIRKVIRGWFSCIYQQKYKSCRFYCPFCVASHTPFASKFI